MEHNMHGNLHWGYGSAAPQSHWAPPPPSHSLKRALSESDCEELFSEESSEKQISPSESGVVHGHGMSRKKRRGVIEKKRRDRINSSLSELKRLVPSAFEKQGSAKLEKAEILQLTVEHLKNLNSKAGMDSLNFDAQRFAMDYHIIGFRECAAEVARYLVTIEGMDIQDPLRLRLMSHLQYFVQQRELSAKSCTSTGGWTAPANAATNMYQNNCTVAPYQTHYTPATTSTYVPNLPVHPYPALSSSPSATHIHTHTHTQQQQHQQQQQQQHQQHMHQQQQATASQQATSATPTNETITLLNQTTAPQANATHAQPAQAQISAAQSTHEIRSPTHHATHHQTHHYAPQQSEHHAQEHNPNASTYIDLTSRVPTLVNNNHQRNTTPEVSSTGVTYAADTQYPDSSAAQAYNANANLQYVGVNGSKPYRPWGAEMAY